MTATQPRILFIYFTYSQQTLRVVEVMAGALRNRGCDVREAKIEFTDPRYAMRFSRFPLMHPYRDIFGMVFPQLLRKTGQIRVPDEARESGYDLVCICSPTWWLNPCMPIRSFLESNLAGPLLARTRFAAVVVCHRYWRNNLRTLRALGTKCGGEYLGGAHFAAGGGSIGSMLAFFSYISKGVVNQRYLGIPIPPPNLQPSYTTEALAFADGLADGLGCQIRTQS
jgi:hypothetical protein